MSNWLQKAYSNLQDKVPGVRESKDLQKELFDYYGDRLVEAEKMTGYNPYVETPNRSYDDMGGRPAPLNPAQFPTLEELDAIRHYYGPQVVSEKIGGGVPGIATSLAVPAGHELEGFVTGDGWSQIWPDIKNNLVASYDEATGKDKYPAGGLLGRLKKDMPPGEFEQFAKHALSRTTIPPKYQE